MRQAKKSAGEKKSKLLKQARSLSALKHNPFDLVVSDINMPRGIPTGVPFVEHLRDRLPRQKVLVHSDDIANMRLLRREHGVEYSNKLNFHVEKLLKQKIARMLKLGKRK